MKRGRDVEEILISSCSEEDEVEEESDDDWEEDPDDTDEEDLFDDEELDDEEDDDEDARDDEDEDEDEDEEDFDESLSENEDEEDDDENYEDDGDAQSSDLERNLDSKTNRRITSGVYGTRGTKSVQHRKKRQKGKQMKGSTHTRQKAISSEEDQKLFQEALNIIRRGGLNKLKFEHYKAYLRNYSLRLTGSISILRDRVREHFELKAHGGMAKYPRSTFTLDCTGDVCMGDVVLFKQKVKTKNNIAERSQLGKRTVAGRIVKESYGSDKQQHTFTVEVLWSKGPKQLPVLYPLLIKGRNLYRFRTFRQPWTNEGDRKKVLQEKHFRGNVARNAREYRVTSKLYSSTRRTEVRKSRGSLALRRERKDTAHTHRKKSSTVAFSGKENGKRAPGNHRTLIIEACYAGILIGTKGRNIDAIKKASGAMLQVCDHPSRPNSRMVKIAGEPEQVQVATQMVVQSFSSKGLPPPVEMT